MSELGQIFSPKMPGMPAMPEVVKQADTEDPKVKEAKQRKIQEDQARGGRDSTMLSPTSGAPSTYSSTQLG